MSIICRTWTHRLVSSDAHTICVTGVEGGDRYAVKVRFHLPAISPEQAQAVAYECLPLEEYDIDACWSNGGSQVTCTFGMSATSHEAAHQVVSKLWRGTPAWRRVIAEVEGWTRHLTNA